MGNAEGLIRRLGKRYDALVARGTTNAAFALRPGQDKPHVFGRGEPAFTIVVKNDAGLAALSTLDLTAVGEAYLHGLIDIEGELSRTLALRELFSDRKSLWRAWHYLRPKLLGQIDSDKRWITQHYDYAPDLNLLFLDQRFHCYSHGVFEHDDEPLERAIERKLDFAIDAAGVGPGQSVLDVGGGWGAFVGAAGRRGIRVTSLTLAKEQERFMGELIAREKLPCKALREHLYEHRPDQPYDAIVNLGATEHLPNYEKTLVAYDRLIKPGGKVYLDACASRRRHDLSSFLLRHIFPGNGTPLCLHEYLAAVARSRFCLTAVYDDRINYYLTSRQWAQRLDQHQDEIERRWGKLAYRMFQVYLWGCADAFQRDVVQAYRVVLYRT